MNLAGRSRPCPAYSLICAAGVKLALENHDRFDSRTLAAIVVELGTEHAGVCLDTVNSFGALEGPAIVVPTLAPYTLSLHVKDFTVRRPPHQMGFVVEGCAAGAGRLDLPWILGVLRAAGRDVNAILETWVTPGPLDERSPETPDRLRHRPPPPDSRLTEFGRSGETRALAHPLLWKPYCFKLFIRW
jgi:sugar phosphate isomerase/epimerase